MEMGRKGFSVAGYQQFLKFSKLHSKNSTEARVGVFCDVSGFWLLHTDTKAINVSKSRETMFFMACTGRNGWLYSLVQLKPLTVVAQKQTAQSLRYYAR